MNLDQTRGRRMFRTTSVVPMNAAVTLRRYAHHAFAWRIMGLLVLFMVLLGLLSWLTIYRDDPVNALTLNLILLGSMTAGTLLLRAVLPRAIAQKHPWGTESLQYVSWLEDGCIHRLDDDGDMYVIPLRKLRYAWRTEGLLLFCTMAQAVVPVNLLMLSGDEQQALLMILEKGCPQLRILQNNRRSSL